MLFSTPEFLFAFLPLVLAGYFVALGFARVTRWGQGPQNLLLLLASLLFYAFGEKERVLWMLLSIAVNWALGLAIERLQGSPGAARAPPFAARWALALGLAFDLALLGYFKYANLLVESWNAMAGGGARFDAWQHVLLPIGISFYTFQSMSYLVDVYRREVPAARNPLDFALFVSLFPQLIAGPIVRYRDVAAQILARRLDLPLFASGVRRFLIGLAKKVLVAEPTAHFATTVFELPGDSLSAPLAWLGLFAFTVGSYYDFSGYSDMAIGLGRMFGFRLFENFQWPLISQSITEMWRRWHISLGSWFKDYVYIPLGGNRGGPWRTYRNLMVVFLLCGLWHGASWNFAIFGLWQGLYLALERGRLGRWLAASPRVLRHVYVLLVWNLGWLFFCFVDLADSWVYAKALLQGGSPQSAFEFERLVDNHLVFVLVLGAVGSTPWVPALAKRLRGTTAEGPVRLLAWCALAVASVLSLAAAAGATSTPFLYFRF